MRRINERNTGSWSVEGQLKVRRGKSSFTQNQKYLLSQVLEKVLAAMEHDPEGRGPLHPESRWTDGGNFTLSMSGEQKDELYTVLEMLCNG